MEFKAKVKIILSLILVVLLFITVSVIVKDNLEFFNSLIKEYFVLGMFLFVIVEILSIVVAPITSLPIIPLASNTYGIWITSILYVIGGIIGSVIAFILGRKLKNKFLSKMVSLQEVALVEEAIPRKHYFWTLVLMRIVIPADILSYALGITSNVSYRIFVLTTIIGIIPSALFFAYLGVLPLAYQMIGWLFGIVMLSIILYSLFKKRKRYFSDKKH